MEIDLVKLVENLGLHPPSLSMENFGLSRMKRSLRWTCLRLSTKRFLARNAEAGAAAGLTTSPRQGLAALLEDHDGGAEVIFAVGDRRFRANRRVLAAGSPVFAAELFGPMKETSTRQVRIDDMEPATFEALLRFASTGALPGDGVAALQHLLVAADRYGMHGLMAACEWRLCRSIDVETVASTLALAEQHRRAKLKDACIRFVSTKSVLSAVRETDGFGHLVETCPLVMVDILEQKLPSTATRILTVCGTHARRGLALFGTGLARFVAGLAGLGMNVASWLGGLGNHVGFVGLGIGVLVFSAFGLAVVVVLTLEAIEEECREAEANERPLTLQPRGSLLDHRRIQESLAEIGSWIARQESRVGSFSLREWLGRQDLSSWIPNVSSLARIQEFQESAWLNSDI